MMENINDETFGMLFFAEVFSFQEIHSEIEKILITDNLVENLTYPLIQPQLIKEAKKQRIFINKNLWRIKISKLK